MGGADVHAVGQGALADDSEEDALVAVVPIDFCAGLQAHTGGVCGKACTFGHADGLGHGLALGLRGVQEVHVILAVGAHRGAVGLGQTVVAVLGGVQQLLTQGFILAHSENSFHVTTR